MRDRHRYPGRHIGWLAAVVAGLGLPLLADGPTWRFAQPSYVVQLPRDHGAHPDSRIEWWYYTGNVQTREGRRFGYQLTFFRFGVDPAPANPSRWAVRDLHLAHLAVSDIGGERHAYADRLNRAGAGWAGAAIDRLEVWNEDWRATRTASGVHVLTAGADGLGLALRLDEGKPAVRHGVEGYSRKGASAGNASHYYSLTRMPTRGTIAFGGEVHEVEGESWMDHEFGSSFLEATQAGWDWLSIQLDDGSELMVYRLRTSGGTPDPHSSGTLVDPAGRSRRLGVADYALRPGREWRSPESGARYPVEWRVDVPGARLTLDVRATFDAQEMRTEETTTVTYWEGAIDVRGTRDGQPVTGRGYLEMTGYTGRPLSEILR